MKEKSQKQKRLFKRGTLRKRLETDDNSSKVLSQSLKNISVEPKQIESPLSSLKLFN